jgi:GMP synthase-like glutamine amidotransferase
MHNNNMSEDIKQRLPIRLEVYTDHGSFTYSVGDVTREPDVLRVAYNGSTADATGEVLADGEPDFVMFDIHFAMHGDRLKTMVNITYGDAMKSEFSLMPPNKVKVWHYEGVGSMADPETHFGFSDRSLKDLVGVFNSFHPSYRFKVGDFKFIDKYLDTYEHNESAKITPLSPEQTLLLIDNSKPPHHRFIRKIRDYLRSRGVDHLSVSNLEEAKEVTGRVGVAGIIMSGSDHNIDDSPENQKLFRWATESFRCPTLAICYAAQTMMRHRGARVLRGELMHDNVKFTEWEQHPLLSGVDCDRFQFAFSFRDFIRKSPPGFRTIAKVGDRVALSVNDDEGEYALFFHPENMEFTHRVLDNFLRMVHPAQAEQDKILSGRFESMRHIRGFDDFRENPFGNISKQTVSSIKKQN